MLRQLHLQIKTGKLDPMPIGPKSIGPHHAEWLNRLKEGTSQQGVNKILTCLDIYSYNMFEWFRRFWHHHKTKVLVTGTIVGGAALLGKYANWKLNKYQDQEAAEFLALTRRQHHFDSNQRTCNMTVLSMIPSLKEKLMKLLNSEALTAELRTKPADKLKIWEYLKITSFTRTIVAVYSSCMLVVMLRIQLNILGAYMYLDTLKSHSGKEMQQKASQDIQQRYLATIQYLVEQGLHELISNVRVAVESAVNRFSLKQCISLQELEAIIGNIRSNIENTCSRDSGNIHSLCKFMVHTGGEFEDSVTLTELSLETRDMVESQLPVTLPLAKVIPIMNGQVHTICSETPNHFIQDLLLMPIVKDFAANVYEAFSQDDTSTAVP
ncbi:peroxisomal biogenesis factor 3-like isoform X2 [Ptychodera flava]|uniref:peroxisomal biogenesis factor 3-like isoform X2 n=1 Tax=Ptychodera flava TaxID=63121 RepID=UPI00396A0CF2